MSEGLGGAPAPDLASRFAHLRAEALAVLHTWRAPDDGQDDLRRQFVAHLESDPTAVAKAGPAVHLTASCLVLDPAAERVLLTHHRRARLWFQFGGHLEATDPTLRAAAAREAREESGIADLELLAHPVHLDRHVLHGDFGRCREHLDVRYVARATTGSEAVLSEESLELRWWPVEALPEGTRDELAPLVSLARAASASADAVPLRRGR